MSVVRVQHRHSRQYDTQLLELKSVTGPDGPCARAYRLIMEGNDRSLIEAASWRLASELMRRHPNDVRLFRGHPGGGQYDLLWMIGIPEPGVDVRLNRNGSIQVHGRADGGHELSWTPTGWSDYLSADPKGFVERLERAVGWSSPNQVPPSTPVTLTYRVLAALAGFGAKTVHPIWIEQGFIDTAGYDGGPNKRMREFTIPDVLTAARPDDAFGEPGYRFWIPVRDNTPLAAIEQTTATAWFIGESEPIDLLAAYRSMAKEPVLVAAAVLRRALGLNE